MDGKTTLLWLRRAALLAGVAQATLLAGGCASRTLIFPPESPASPTDVLVLDHGRHASMILPHPRGSVRYAYGDRTWYAGMQTSMAAGSSAVLRASPAVLGRRVLTVPPREARVLRAVGVGVEEAHPVTVDARRAAELRRELQSLYAAGAEPIENSVYNLTFVSHPEPYSARHNSNHKVAEWLERLGCRVEGSAFWSRWKVVRESP